MDSVISAAERRTPRATSPNQKLKLLYLVTEDWYFVSHRLQHAVAAQAAGFDVAVATRVGRHGDAIRNAGIRLIPFALSRRGGNPLREVMAIWRLYRREKPDLVHHVALKPVVYGSFAARLARVPRQVNAVAGLGWLFTSTGVLARVARPALCVFMAWLLRHQHSLTIVQNPEDQATLERIGVPAASLRLIRGAGVDTSIFRPLPHAGGTPCILFVARMLWDKGVGEFVEAARILSEAKVSSRFVLVGDPDPGNPVSVPESTLKGWHGRHGVEWWGKRDDMPAVFQAGHIACLPSSYGEGVPKSLLEAAACGLPIVTSDAPGCREVVQDGMNGLLVPQRDATALAAALRRLIEDPAMRRRMGEQSRLRAEKEFGLDAVISETLAVYREVCA